MSWTAGSCWAIAAVPINPRFVTVTAPTGTTSKNQGEALPVTWTTNQAVATGQFSIWVVSPANGWYVGKIVAADGGPELRVTRSTSTCPPTPATACSSTTGPRAATPGASTA